MTAATQNVETRDHLNFLKGFGDLITNSTTADTGTATYLSITRTASTDTAFRSLVTADTVPRLAVLASGKLEWGTGAAAADTNLYRVGVDNLKTDDTLSIGTWEIVNSGYLVGAERADTGNSPADTGILYFRDNGAGKTQFVCVFSTGSVQILATQP